MLRSTAQPGATSAPAPARYAYRKKLRFSLFRPAGGLSAEDFQRALQQAAGSSAAAQSGSQGSITDLRRVLNADALLATGIFNDPRGIHS